ncbi:hypothetical protein SAMN05880501_10577 [Ureibacillus xyleni]|uniref:Uncharacterized protein n=1 Tax=Ureibacillus xyleni TaxID=614648 RepID=A0A285SLY2_9BACL|nr:hypothetical protein [Ureibacillus xyleni]SOC08416.1 hypothetical protein SAMN05880501_10577 [Ureibacillus xyleni]
MKEFKDKLKEELRNEVPFTADVKGRLMQVNPKRQRTNWQVHTITVSACVLLIFLFITQLSPKSEQALSSEVEPLSIITADSSKIINPEYAFLLGNQWMLRGLPMIIEENVPLNYGDYVAYYTVNGIAVSTVLGLAGDQVHMEQGQISVNSKILKVHGLGEKIDKNNQDDPLQNPYFFHNISKVMDNFINKELLAKKSELVIYDNQSGHTITTITDAQVIGKVVGVQNFKPTFSLNKDEKVLYDAFKESLNIELFKDVSPLSIAKIYIMAEMELEYEMSCALFTTVEDPSTKQIRQYNKKAQKIREAYFTREIQYLISAYVFAGLEKGTFREINATSGEITYISTIDGSETSFNMRKNEDGIWQPAFSRALY